jgi:eukaryotic-like serine/threonine-protein kinase
MPPDPKTHDDTLPSGPSFEAAHETIDSPSSPLARSTVASTPMAVSGSGPEITSDESFDARYEIVEKIGEGGMGEVHLCADRRIGRDVAIKVVRSTRASRPDVRRRFLREARVQGQLEHPSIVPVYDLAHDPNGRIYFTMRRVRGATLEAVLDRLRTGDLEARAVYTRHKLLSAFGSVCLAVHFAHTRGVLHRDLKPANIMLGDFGEVYVLDWGLAKVGLDDDRTLPDEGEKPVSGDATIESEPVRTAHGSVLGTPGFMAPEQVHGDVDLLDARTDVYALGAILFEIITLEPLHGFGDANKLTKSTIVGADARPSVRAPHLETAPELDEICRRATAHDPANRFANARLLYERVEAFLSGDRDVALRRSLARGHAKLAREAAKKALEANDGAAEARRDAMREIGRVLALDPENEEATRTLLQLFTAMPRELPAAAAAELDAARVASQRASAWTASIAYASWLFYMPLVLWMGVRDFGWGLTCDVLWVGAGAASFWASKGRSIRLATDVALVLSMLATACAAGLFGPFTLLPTIAVVNTMLFVMTAEPSRRWVSAVLGCFAVLVPFMLEQLGVLPPSMRFDADGMTLLPRVHDLAPGKTLVFLLLANVAVIVTATIFVARFRDALLESERRLHFQAWQLRQLVPDDAVPSMHGARGVRAVRR